MEYILVGHNHDYETQTIIQVFCPNNKYNRVDKPSNSGLCVLSSIIVSECTPNKFCTSEILLDGASIAKSKAVARKPGDKEEQRLVKLTIYEAFLSYTHEIQPWGILTGIRPAKMVSDLWRLGVSDEQIYGELINEFFMTDQKAKLSIEVAKVERKILEAGSENRISLYMGVPFCPSRCLYCSFTSFAIERYTKKMESYFVALEKEIRHLSLYASEKKLESVYIGGGTPTSLSDSYFERLLYDMTSHFDIKNADEFTVEAGRPDTITVEKLKIMKRFGVTRISINPQTMNNNTLENIGRKHTAEDFINAYGLARKMGFNNINIDVILGLPGETVEDVENTFLQLADLYPDAITVHTLAVKRASNLNQNLSGYTLVKREEMEEMLKISSKHCRAMGLAPYYMYRQKNMIGNFENVGYCKKGYECVYNIQIMEENQTILALGAGAVTKIVEVPDGKIERIFNVKGIEEYIARIDEMLERKRKKGM